MRKLENVKVTHVSYVDKAANKKKFFLTKSAAEPTFETEVKLLTKAEDPQKLVYGVVYEPDAEDAHGDFMDAETIEKAAHDFMENYQQIDKQHDFTTQAGKVVESYIAPTEMKIGKSTISQGTWVLVTKATDEMWEDIQKGEFTGYSLAGSAEVEEIEKATSDIFNKRKTYRDINAAIDAFRAATWSILDKYEETDADKLEGIQNEINELSALITGIQPVTKAVTKQGLISMVKSIFNTKKEEEVEMTPTELKKALEEALQPVNDRLAAIEKGENPAKVDEKDPKKAKDPKKEDEQAIDAKEVAKAVAEAVAPLNEKIEQLEKARVSNNHETSYQANVAKSEAVPSYVDAAFPLD
ncbi:XkdF-like putative serine protease domain-containing protein [Lactococcus formosensis]|uniref:XkdF-like putative serine protease domain-containing protein n=1 Tax=Lactococcus formosensis TaxID=1281486 RepID=UPI001F05385C|nr:XkdF-like putative serine protease domain-containing protein [Lactococcus formosensis]MCH1722673.1 XkdF-like putative serine protease domain-containing protein [Lactococcus formosensis]